MLIAINYIIMKLLLAQSINCSTKMVIETIHIYTLSVLFKNWHASIEEHVQAHLQPECAPELFRTSRCVLLSIQTKLF